MSVRAIVLDSIAAALREPDGRAPDTLAGMPPPAPRWLERSVRALARRRGCTCADPELRTVALDDDDGRIVWCPLLIHAEGCPLVARVVAGDALTLALPVILDSEDRP